jgi:hypothetical protein
MAKFRLNEDYRRDLVALSGWFRPVAKSVVLAIAIAILLMALVA